MSRPWCLSVALLVALVAREAFAELDERETRAFEEFERGRRFFEAEDYVAAADHFEAAYRIMPSASVHYNIARSYQLAEMPEQAAEHYRSFLDARAGSPSRRRQVEETLDSLSEGLGWVRVLSEPEGATLRVRERDRGRTPALLALGAGTHRIDADVEGRSGSVTVEVEPGAEREVTIVIGRGEEPEPDIDVGPQPPVEFDRPEPDRTPPDDVPRDRPARRQDRGRRVHHGWFWAALGLTVASGVALGAVGASMLDLSSEYNRLVQIPESERTAAQSAWIERLQADGPALEGATTALWVTTGVLAAVTVVLAIFTDWSALGSSGGSAAPDARLGWLPRLEPLAACATSD
jgi:hypothetical protein